MITIKSIHIRNMHNPSDRKYGFNNVLNYIVGPNGAGKSTILQAIQLALLGYIPGVGPKKSKEAIMAHAKGNWMSVCLVLNKDGEEISIQRSWQRTKTSIISKFQTSPDYLSENDIRGMLKDIELPIFNFDEFKNMTANMLKDWFINFMPKADATIVWRDYLSEVLEGTPYYDANVLDDFLNYIPEKANSVADVRKVNEMIRSHLSFKKSEVSRCTDTIKSLVFYDDVDSTLTEADLTAQRYATHDNKMTAEMYKNAVATNLRLKQSVPDTSMYAASLEEDVNFIQLTKELEDMGCRPEYNIIEMQNALADAKVAVREADRLLAGKGICPYSQELCDTITSLMEEMRKKKADAQEEIAALTAKIESASQVLTNYDAKRTRIESDILALKTTYDQVAKQRQFTPAYVPVPEIDPAILDVNWDEIISDIDNKIVRVRSNENYRRLMNTVTKQKYSAEMYVECLKLWEKATGANGLQSTMSNKPFEQFAQKITENLKYTMSADVTAAFHLEEKANSFTFGINRDGEYISFDLLSSGEKCMYALALMMTIVDVSSDELKLIIVDDMLDHLDDANIENLFSRLSKVSDKQFVFAGVKNVTSVNTIKLSK